MLEISRSWASRSKIPPYLLEFFLEIRDAVLERGDFFFHRWSSLLNEVGFYKDESLENGHKTQAAKKTIKPRTLHLYHRIVSVFYRRKLRSHRKKSDKQNQALRIKSTEPKHDEIKNQAHSHR